MHKLDWVRAKLNKNFKIRSFIRFFFALIHFFPFIVLLYSVFVWLAIFIISFFLFLRCRFFIVSNIHY